ncbi:MAG: helix-turn-helix transcriptional regulator [Ignavibacteriales bacterium]|nr:helix-turn-helix transcriptional regulator [Ignavibacteriales bacterium]
MRKQVRQILREYMYKNEINQTQLAQKLEIDRSLVSQIINEKQNISLDRLEEYCNKLGVELQIQIDWENIDQIRQLEGEKNE